MKTVSEIRSAKNAVNRTLFYNKSEKEGQFRKEINELILKTPTGQLRDTYTNLNILVLSMINDYEDLIKLHQI